MTDNDPDEERRVIRPDEWYRCVACRTMFDDQLQYERHLFVEHDRMRDTLAAVIDDEDDDN